jgi:hypothetical protein
MKVTQWVQFIPDGEDTWIKGTKGWGGTVRFIGGNSEADFTPPSISTNPMTFVMTILASSTPHIPDVASSIGWWDKSPTQGWQQIYEGFK